MDTRERAFHDRVAWIPRAAPEQTQRLVAFALACVKDTPLPGGLTPLARLRGRTHSDQSGATELVA